MIRLYPGVKDAAGKIASGLFTTFSADTPDGERFLQTLKGRFLCFAPISSVSPQKSSNIHAIYYLGLIRTIFDSESENSALL